MRRVLCFVLVAAVAANSASAADKKTKTNYKLPKNPKAVVISFDYAGGFRPRRKNKSPMLSILADGTVQMPDRFGASKDVNGKISQAELQDLLRFAIEEKKFFEYDAENVKDKIKESEKGKRVPRIADAPSSVFEIRTAERNHKVSHYALGMVGQFYKDVNELQQLYAIQQRLNRLMNETRLGGKAELKKMIKLANAELKKKFPTAQPLTVDDFRGVSIRRDGTKTVSFYRYGKGKDGKPNRTYVGVGIQIPEKGDPKVSIRAKLKP
jgi:hypothetical protein